MTEWKAGDLMRYRVLSFCEESAEIFGTTLLLLTAVAYLEALQKSRATKASVEVPTP